MLLLFLHDPASSKRSRNDLGTISEQTRNELGKIPRSRDDCRWRHKKVGKYSGKLTLPRNNKAGYFVYDIDCSFTCNNDKKDPNRKKENNQNSFFQVKSFSLLMQQLNQAFLLVLRPWAGLYAFILHLHNRGSVCATQALLPSEQTHQESLSHPRRCQPI